VAVGKRRDDDVAAPIYDLLEWPLEQWRFRHWRSELWRPVDGPEVLEIGVGTGKNIPYYPEDVAVTGIDLSPNMLTHAEDRAQSFSEKDVTLREMDAQALDVPDSTFDEVVATFVFCSVPDPVQGLREALRVVRPGGHLRLLEHMRAGPLWLAQAMEALDAPLHWLTGVHIARETVDNVRRAGWNVQEAESLGFADIFRRIVAVKPS
jgi:ubiquinone/menaquinone biosynthesis C-methylase UbiE